MTVDAMRSYILQMYPGESWKRKVYNMRDSQVMAVYFSFKNKNKEPIKGSNEKQITIFDYDSKGRYNK